MKLLTIKINYFFILLFLTSVHCAKANDKKILEDSFFNAILDEYAFFEKNSLLIKKLEVNNGYGYFCGAAKYDNGHFIKHNGYIAVFDFIMKVDKDNKWMQTANFNTFHPSINFSCKLDSGLHNMDLEIKGGEGECVSVPKNSPQRKKILDATRNDNDKFIVKRICATPHYSYFCGIAMDEKGSFDRTGVMLDVYNVVLSNSKGAWERVVDLGAFARNSSDIKCYYGSDDSTKLDESTLKSAVEVFMTKAENE